MRLRDKLFKEHDDYDSWKKAVDEAKERGEWIDNPPFDDLHLEKKDKDKDVA